MDMGIVNAQQVKEDVYAKINKELLTFVEDVLLNRRPDSTVRSSSNISWIHLAMPLEQHQTSLSGR